ncbi:MAG: hypothetical protein KGZ30_01960 [Anaplasmataceae bacterium]|nr:hypothetical protein [Anaplasmataceae bacterium]
MGYAVIYDQLGCSPLCVLATETKIKHVIDDRRYQVLRFSEKSSILDNHRDHPIKLFVIPGGNYREMEPSLRPIAASIQRLVHQEGVNYLGICAGGIAASKNYLYTPSSPLSKTVPHQNYDLTPYPLISEYLGLYPGSTCWLNIPKLGESTQLVEPIDVTVPPYPLYFHTGCFFPNAQQIDNTSILLRYSDYSMQGVMTEPTGSKTEYQEIKPAAAIRHKKGDSKGNGNIVLSGIHPEIDEDLLSKQSPPAFQALQQNRQDAITTLATSTREQERTLQLFFDALEIERKP